MKGIAEYEVTCDAVPIQIEGRLDDGRWFYFRSRFTSASLGAGTSLEEAVEAGIDGAGIYRDLAHLGEFGAGMISIPEALDMLAEMAADLTANTRASVEALSAGRVTAKGAKAADSPEESADA